MGILYNFVIEENKQLVTEREELLQFLDSAQVAISHLISDGDIADNESAQTTAKNLLSQIEELQNKFKKV